MRLPKSSRSRYSQARRIDCVLPLDSKTAHRAARRRGPRMDWFRQSVDWARVAIFRHKGRLIVIKQELQPQREGSKTAGAPAKPCASTNAESGKMFPSRVADTRGVNSKKGAGYTHAGPRAAWAIRNDIFVAMIVLVHALTGRAA